MITILCLYSRKNNSWFINVHRNDLYVQPWFLVKGTSSNYNAEPNLKTNNRPFRLVLIC